MEMKNKVHKLFGERAERVTTEEMRKVCEEISYLLRYDLPSLHPTRSLSCKTDHGDIDLVYRSEPTLDVKKVLSSNLGFGFIEMKSNGDVISVLYHSVDAGKTVHIDFIKADDRTFQTKLQYFSFNDFSGIFGMLSKKYHFKYGSEGFFKRYCDSRGNWHDILVSRDLTVGMELLGYDPDLWLKMENYEDIIAFMLTSPMFDYRLFVHDSLNQSDKKSMKRPVVEYVVQKLRESGKTATINDENHFFKDTTAHHFCEIQKMVIEDRITQRKLEREGRLTNDSQG